MSLLIKSYIDEIKKYPLLTKDEEISLNETIKLGEQAEKELENETNNENANLQEIIAQGKIAKETFIASNYRLVIKIARDYAVVKSELEDLIQNGMFGLIRAVEKFDPSYNTRFSTYATYWIKEYIERFLQNENKTIKTPRQVVRDRMKMLNEIEEYQLKHKRQPSIETLEKLTGFNEDYIFVLENLPVVGSLNQVIDDKNDLTYLDVIEDKGALTSEEIYNEKENTKILYQLLNTLPEREKLILMLRYGILNGKNYTLQQVGNIVNLSIERVRQLENSSLEKLKENAKENNLIYL